MRNCRSVLGLLLGLGLSSSAFTYDFSNEDRLFETRSSSFKAATAARGAYKSAAENADLSEKEKLYALQQVGRLDIYRGMMAENVSDDDRKDALEACIDDMDMIEDTGHQIYHYFKIACIAGRGKLAENFLDRARWGLKLRAYQDDALQSTKNENGDYVGGIEGGGILRVMSAVRGNLKAKALGLYDPTEGVEFAKAALESKGGVFSPVPSRCAPQHLSGQKYYENRHYVGQATVSLGIENDSIEMVEKGRSILNKTIKILNKLRARGKIPCGREPETKYYQSLMTELVNDVNECSGVQSGIASWKSSWKQCLITKLED